jgi:hypothetical protein
VSTTKIKNLYELLRFVANHLNNPCGDVLDQVCSRYGVQKRAAQNNLGILIGQGWLEQRRNGNRYNYGLTETGHEVLAEQGSHRLRWITQAEHARSRYSTCSTRRPYGERPEVGRILRRGAIPALTPEYRRAFDEGRIAFCPECARRMNALAPDGIVVNLGGGVCQAGHVADIITALGWEDGYHNTLRRQREEAEAEAFAALPPCSCGRAFSKDNPPYPDDECQTCANERYRRKWKQDRESSATEDEVVRRFFDRIKEQQRASEGGRASSE